MSTIAIVVTNNIVSIASDSKVSGGRTHDKFPKIREYQDDLAFFCMGDANFTYNAFKFLDQIKPTRGNMSFLDAMTFINDNKAGFEANPQYADLRTLFGVAGVRNDKPAAYVTMINAKNTNEFTRLMVAHDQIPLYQVLPPEDVDYSSCQEILRRNIPSTDHLTPRQIIALERHSIHEISRRSAVVNQLVQYWLYQVSPRSRMTQLIRELPK